MKFRSLVLGALLPLAACSTDFDSVGQAPQLTPVGSGIAESSTPDLLASTEAFSAQGEGWTGGSADYFRDARAKRKGDIITVKIAIDDQASLNNTSNRSKKANSGADLGLTYDVMKVIGADVNGKGAVNSTSSASGQGSTVRSEKIDMSVAAIVTSVLPNGYLVIEGTQEVLVNFEERSLKVAGIVHPGDITPDNTISYEKIAEARISYGGRGRLTEVQQPGWGQQIWDTITPF